MKILGARPIKTNAVVGEPENGTNIPGLNPTVRTAVLVLNGITFVPHMTKPVFIGPGYIYSDAMKIHAGREFTPAELMNFGACRKYEFLWPRNLGHGEQNFSFREVDRFSKPELAVKAKATSTQCDVAVSVAGGSHG